MVDFVADLFSYVPIYFLMFDLFFYGKIIYPALIISRLFVYVVADFLNYVVADLLTKI